MKRNDERKDEVYRFINNFIKEYGVSPSYNEIASSIKCAKSTLFKYMTRLEEEGLIERFGRNQMVTIENSNAIERIPVIGTVACGKPKLAYEDMGDFMMHKTYTPNMIPLRSKKNRGEEVRFYCENANVPIISKEEFNMARKLQTSRAEKYSGRVSKQEFFSKKIKCHKCGWAFKRLQDEEDETWGCTHRGMTSDICHAPKLKTTEIENAFVRMYNALQENSKKVLEDTIGLLQTLKAKCNSGNTAIAEIDSELLTLTTQDKAYADMLASGLFDQVTYSEKSDRIKRKIQELRSRRLKILNSDNDEKCIEELRELKRILEQEPKAIKEFSKELFSKIVQLVYVEQDGAITFKVKGDLELKVRR